MHDRNKVFTFRFYQDDTIVLKIIIVVQPAVTGN